MASLTEPRCTCAAYWQGRGQRPECVLHEVDGHPPDELPPGKARRADGRVVDVLATIAAPGGGGHRDPEGMRGTWRPWP